MKSRCNKIRANISFQFEIMLFIQTYIYLTFTAPQNAEHCTSLRILIFGL
jgi:hypothetical protein